MPHPTPYLGFDGNCADAMRFYEKALNGTLQVLMTNGESPLASHFPAETHGRILHARLALPDGGMLMAGDTPPSATPYTGIKGVAITLNYDSTADAERAFASLAEGGKITMPMQPTFWAKTWGMLQDRFGVGWIVNGELLPL